MKSPDAARKPRSADRRAEAIRLNNLGTAYMNQQQFERALRLFRQAYAADPKLIVARLNEGIALLNLQRFPAAQRVLTDAAKRNPQNPRPLYNLGLLNKAQGDAKSALQAFQRAAQLEPKDTDVFYFIGSMYSQLGDEKQAATAFERSLQLAPENASAEFGLARSYQRLKDQEKARAHLARFDQITKTKQGKLMSLAYGDQGLLSLAAPASGAQPVPPAIKVTFVDVTSRSGISALQRSEQKSTVQPATSSLGSGACFLDFNDNGKTDVLLPGSSGLALFRGLGEGNFENVTAAAGLPSALSAISCAAGDYDNDGHVDIALATSSGIRLFHNEGSKGNFADATATAQIIPTQNATGLTFIDLDHDGDLDLFITSLQGQGAVLRNNGNATFTNITADLGIAAKNTSTALATDFNNDRAIDLVITSPEGPALVFENPREGKWRQPDPWSEKTPGTTAIASLDFNKDGWMDLALTHASAPALTLWRNAEGKKFERVPVPIPDWKRAFGVITFDYDSDGWLDLAAVGETSDGKTEIRVFRNLGPQGFQDATSALGLTNLKLAAARSLVAADVDDDGDSDLLVTSSEGLPTLLRNHGGNQNNFLKISLKGLADNKTAIGTKIEVFAGALRQKWELSPAALFGQNSTEIVAGLGKEKSVDVVRLLWPTGVVQDEAELPARTTQKITEIDRRGSSCPLLFAWDGMRYRFVADMIGAGVVGHWISPTQKNIPDPTEYVKLEGIQPALKNGRISLRFMEPMEEVVYLDQARLLAVDHPAGTDVYSNEYFASNPPFVPFKVITSRDPHPPVAAWGHTGKNVLPQLLKRDRQYVTGFKILPWMGFTEPHSLTLQLPQPYTGGPLRLLMTGYIEYFMANSMYAAHQAGVEPFAPYLEAQRGDGTWQRVIDDLGFPAGLYRTMTADLTGKLPNGITKIRLTTNLQIYWDQVLVDTTSDPSQRTRISEVPIASAALAFHGYPRMTELSTTGDLVFDYHDVSSTGPYVRQTGSYTRFGSVTDLVAASDDRFVIFGSGDEVRLEFDPSTLPDLPQGWSRDYFFFADGFEKDMDFYAAEGTTVGPLPFHRMTMYPYTSSESYPDDPSHVQYRLEHNSRHESGAWPTSLLFKYPGEQR
jgi:Flp pilus assembly protein TadD